MIAGMTTKIAVSLPDEQVAAARAAVADGRAPSVSAYVSEALARRSAEEELLQLLDNDDATGKPVTDQHRVWARQALGVGDSERSQGKREEAPSAPGRTRSTKTAATGRYVTKSSAGRHSSTSAGEARSASRGR